MKTNKKIMKNKLTLKVKENTKACDIFFYKNFSEIQTDESGFFVFDTTTYSLFSKSLTPKHFFVMPSGEAAKNIETVQEILRQAIDQNIKRDSVLYAVGGGVVCDIASFVASVCKRGIRLVLIPTTLLAMVDAGIGGKTGFDFAGVKNAVGTFYLPDRVYIVTESLKTLPAAELKNGLAEIIKIAMINEKKLFTLLQQKPDSLFTDEALMRQIIMRAVRGKIKLVSKDFYDRSVRMYLNVGHTFAHALEAVSHFTIPHGAAVAWGIAQELKLGMEARLVQRHYTEAVFTLLERLGFDPRFFSPSIQNAVNSDKKTFIQNLLLLLQSDKKNADDSSVTFALSKNLNRTGIERIDTETVKKFLLGVRE